MIKTLLLFGLIFLWPIFSTVLFLLKKKNNFVKGISSEDLNAFRKLYAYVTIFVAAFMCIFSQIDVVEPFKVDFILEIIFFDILSAFFLLIAGQWWLGILGVLFFSSHMTVVVDILLSGFVPEWLIIFCIFMYPLTSWIQFKQTAIPLERTGLKGD